MKKISILSAIAAIALVACTKPDPTPNPDPDPTPGPAEAFVKVTSSASNTVVADGGTVEITFNSNAAWTAESDQAWATVSPANGAASEKALKVTVTVAKNEATEGRNAKITIKADKASAARTLQNSSSTLRMSRLLKNSLPLSKQAQLKSVWLPISTSPAKQFRHFQSLQAFSTARTTRSAVSHSRATSL